MIVVSRFAAKWLLMLGLVSAVLVVVVGTPVEMEGNDEVDPLVAATRAQDWEEVKRLMSLQPHARSDLAGALDAGLLLASAGANRNDVLFLLLDTHNVDPNLRVPGGDQKTALMAAIQSSNFDGAERLLESGAEPDLLDSANWTALHYAAKNGDAGITRRLATLVDARAVTIDGNTALHYAAQYRNPGAIFALCESANPKPNVNAHNELSQTPLRLGCCDNIGVIGVLLEKCRADPDETDYLNRTPLHYAAKEGAFEAVKQLVLAGANPSIVDDMTQTARIIAKKENHGEMAKYLRNAEKQYMASKTTTLPTTTTTTSLAPFVDYIPEEEVEEDPEEETEDDLEEPEEDQEEAEMSHHVKPDSKPRDHSENRVEPKKNKKKKEEELYNWIQYFAPFLFG